MVCDLVPLLLKICWFEKYKGGAQYPSFFILYTFTGKQVG